MTRERIASRGNLPPYKHLFEFPAELQGQGFRKGAQQVDRIENYNIVNLDRTLYTLPGRFGYR
jgi:hypothetical protein